MAGAIGVGVVALAVQGLVLATELGLFYREFCKQAGQRTGERHQLLDSSIEMLETKVT